jgi:streptomycin 6-kinase
LGWNPRRRRSARRFDETDRCPFRCKGELRSPFFNPSYEREKAKATHPYIGLVHLRRALGEIMRNLPPNFVQTQQELYGDRGLAWLENLPQLIAECEKRWSLTVHTHVDGLSYNFVAPAVRADGMRLMLKLGVPNQELNTEIEALRLYDGRGICRLIDADAEQGILLLERLQPGVMLSTVDDDEQATRIAAGVMRQMWRPAPAVHGFPTAARWANGLERLRAEFGGGTGPFPGRLVEQAERLYTELLASSAEPMLLHGDLHHFNILTAERQPWLAIDPKGVVGEPAYELGALLRNPTDKLVMDRKVQGRRVELLASELAIDRQRILGWGIAQAVLSGWWSYEDHGYGWEPMMSLAELLAALADQL